MARKALTSPLALLILLTSCNPVNDTHKTISTAEPSNQASTAANQTGDAQQRVEESDELGLAAAVQKPTLRTVYEAVIAGNNAYVATKEGLWKCDTTSLACTTRTYPVWAKVIDVKSVYSAPESDGSRVHVGLYEYPSNSTYYFLSKSYADAWSNSKKAIVASGRPIAKVNSIVSSGNTIFIGTEQGVAWSTNGGGSWSLAEVKSASGAIIEITKLAVSNNGPTLFASGFSGVFKATISNITNNNPQWNSLSTNFNTSGGVDDIYVRDNLVVVVNGPRIGLSRDAGSTWVLLPVSGNRVNNNKDSPFKNLNFKSVATLDGQTFYVGLARNSPAAQSGVYAITINPQNNYVTNVTPLNSGSFPPVKFDVMDIALKSKDGRTQIYAATNGEGLKFFDGSTWRQL